VQARFWVWRYSLLPTGFAGSADDLGAFAIDMAVSVAATFAVAFVSHRLIEQPAAKLGARLEPLLFGSPAAEHKTVSAATSGKASTAVAGAAASAA
jgi:peptidoglycan/LPS O-acetylase OafA/YrhL